MEFLYPSFLWALAVLSIPVIIHLFNFRRFKRVIFPNVRFLKDIQQQTRSQSRLKHLLVLLLRLLALALLVFAFAQPVIPQKHQKAASLGKKHVSVYIDNSFSMSAEGSEGELLEQAKEKARDILKAYAPDDAFQIVTNELKGSQQRWINREEAGKRIDEIETSPAATTISRVITRQRDMPLDGSKQIQSYLLSDFQKSTCDIQQVKADSSFPATLIPLMAERPANLYIDSVWFASPIRQSKENERLMVRIRNAGDRALSDVPLTLRINGVQKSLGSFAVNPQSYTDTALTYTDAEAGVQHGWVHLDDAPVTFDNDFYFSYLIAPKLNILTVNPAQQPSGWRNYFKTIFGNDPHYKLDETDQKQIDYRALSNYNLIVLFELPSFSSGQIQEFTKFVQNGGSLCLIPSADADASSYNQLLSALNAGNLGSKVEAAQRATSIDNAHPLFRHVFEQIPKNIDLPSCQWHYKLSLSGNSISESVITFRNGDPLLMASEFKTGKVYTFAAPLNSTDNNISQHAIFVTAALRMAELSSSPQNLFRFIGDPNPIIINHFNAPVDQPLALRNVKTEEKFIPETRNVNGNSLLFLHNSISKAENYDVIDRDSVIASLGLNFNRKESDLTDYSIDELQKQLTTSGLFNFNLIDKPGANLTHTIQNQSRGLRLWKLCVILAITALFLEILLLRFWKS